MRTPKAKPLTFGDYAERWLPAGSEGTDYAQCRTILDKFLLPEFGERDLTAITAADVRSWFARVPTGKVYRGHAYGLLRSFQVRWPCSPDVQSQSDQPTRVPWGSCFELMFEHRMISCDTATRSPAQ